MSDEQNEQRQDAGQDGAHAPGPGVDGTGASATMTGTVAWGVAWDAAAGKWRGRVTVTDLPTGTVTDAVALTMGSKISEAEESARLGVLIATWLTDNGVTDQDVVGRLVTGAVDKKNNRELGKALGDLFGGSGMFGFGRR